MLTQILECGEERIPLGSKPTESGGLSVGSVIWSDANWELKRRRSPAHIEAGSIPQAIPATSSSDNVTLMSSTQRAVTAVKSDLAALCAKLRAMHAARTSAVEHQTACRCSRQPCLHRQRGPTSPMVRPQSPEREPARAQLIADPRPIWAKQTSPLGETVDGERVDWAPSVATSSL